MNTDSLAEKHLANLLHHLGFTVTDHSLFLYEKHKLTLVRATVKEPLPKEPEEFIHNIQILVRALVSKELKTEAHEIYSLIDINNIITKDIRETETKSRIMAARAESFGIAVAMTPMNPLARKIVHNTLESVSAVRTESAGVGLGRHIVIYPTGE